MGSVESRKCKTLNEIKRENFSREAFKATNAFKKEFKLRKIESEMKFWANRKKRGDAICTLPLL